MSKADALTVLANVKFMLGRNYKVAIRTAWETGQYDGHLGQYASELQTIRNGFGPSWLVNARP